MSGSRMPRIGDLIVSKCRDTEWHSACHCHTTGSSHVGLVKEIEFDKYGDSRNVRIEWASVKPLHYSDMHGYHGTNIHNLRSEFRIFRDGIEIK